MAKNNKLTVVASQPIDKVDDTKDITEDVPLDDAKDVKKDGKESKESKTEAKEFESKSDAKVNDKSKSDAKVDDKSKTGAKADKKELEPESKEESAPPKPKRPVSPVEQMKQDLKDAFPNVEDKLITTVLIAASGVLEQAFNALLYYSDPTIEPEIPSKVVPVPLPATTTDDELLARKLQQEFEQEERRRHRERKAKKSGSGERRSSRQDNNDSPDEFETIKETFTQGFEEAKTTINGWVSGIAKKFDNEGSSQPQKNEQGKLFGALGGSSFNNQSRRNNNRFDEDPRIITSDFHQKISMNDEDNDKDLPSLPTRKSNEKSAAATTTTPQSTKKWQPLNSDVPPNSDAFLVDSDEDDDNKNKL